MNSNLEAQYFELEHSRLQLIQNIDGFDQEILETSPAKDKWSATQILFHLNTAETLSILYVSKKMKGAATMAKSGIISNLRIRLATMVLSLPFIKFKAPKVLGDVPSFVDYNFIKSQWADTRKKLKQLLESIPEDDLEKELFKQPAAGRMNIYQMLDFMQSHFNRHRRQIYHITTCSLSK